MRRLWPALVSLFDHKEEATSLACVRIAVGLIVLYSMISAAWAGLVGSLWVDVGDGGFMPIKGSWLIQFIGGADQKTIWALFALTCGGAVFLIVGLASRLAALVTLFCYAALVSTHADTSGGADIMTTNALWILALSPAGTTLSLAAKLRTGSFFDDRAVSAWPRYILIFQIIVIYTAAGWNKMAAPWTPGGGYTALHYVLQDPTFVRFGVETFRGIAPLTRIATALTWHWEQLTFLLLVYYYCGHTAERGGRIRRWVLRFDWRKGWVVVGIGLHIGIFITLNVGAFSFIALAYYFALFRPAEVRALLVRIRAILER